MDTGLFARVSFDNLKHDLFYLTRDPLSFRTVSYTIPWHTKNSLEETDDFIAGEMRKYTDDVTLIPNKIQAFRCDSSKPLHHWYSGPKEDDPWYDANNIVVTLPGRERPDEIIQLVSHKDSMSWINSPGAHDNCTGTIVNMELVRVLAALPHRRTIRVLFCNEEHAPWHSLTFAKAAQARGDHMLAVLNQDTLASKTAEEIAAGDRVFASYYSTTEGQRLAEYLVSLGEKYRLGLTCKMAPKKVNDDDGSFVKSGYPTSVMNGGSAYEAYHLPIDTPEIVDLVNLQLATRLLLGGILELAEGGAKVFLK